MKRPLQTFATLVAFGCAGQQAQAPSPSSSASGASPSASGALPPASSSVAATTSAVPSASTSAPPAPSGPRVEGRISWGCGPTDAPAQSLVIFDHPAACNESMPAGTFALFQADISGATVGKPTRLARGGQSCTADGACSPVTDVTITYTLQGEVSVGEVTFTLKGRAKRIAFRALSCPVPQGERVICG